MQEGLIGIVFMEYPSDFVTSRSILRVIEYKRLYFFYPYLWLQGCLS